MSDIIFATLGWTLLLAGVFVAWWWGWRDPGKRIRRCPKCRYDMSAIARNKCPECGFEARDEKYLHRPQRRCRWIFAGVVLILGSWCVSRWPEYQRTSWSTGPLAFVPRTVLVVAWPAIAKWLEASAETPGAWWAKSDARSMWHLPGVIEDSELWSWQRWLKFRIAAEEIRHTKSWSVLLYASEMVVNTRERPDFATDAFMARYVDESPELNGFNIWDLRAKIYPLPAKWKQPVADAIRSRPQIMRFDPQVVAWLAGDGFNMNGVADAVIDNKFPRPVLGQLAGAFINADLDQAHLARLVQSFRRRDSVGRGVVVQLIGRLEGDKSAYTADLLVALSSNSLFDRLWACVCIAQCNILDPAVLEALSAARCDAHVAVCTGARMADALLLHDERELEAALDEACAFLHEFKKRDVRAMTSMALVEFAEKGLLPPEMCLRALDAASDGDNLDNWGHSMFSLSVLVKKMADDDPRVVALIARRIKAGQPAGLFVVRHYVAQGSAPKPIVDALRERCALAVGDDKKHAEEQLQRLQERP